MSVPEYTADIERNEPVLSGLLQPPAFRVFRFPYLQEGETAEKRDAVRSYLQQKRYRTAEVTVDFEDWAWNGPYVRCATAKDSAAVGQLAALYIKMAVRELKVAERLSARLFKRQVKHILLLHIGAFDAYMMDRLLAAYERQGVTFISLTEAMADPVYRTDSHYLSPIGRPLLRQLVRAGKPEPPNAEDPPHRKILAAMCS